MSSVSLCRFLRALPGCREHPWHLRGAPGSVVAALGVEQASQGPGGRAVDLLWKSWASCSAHCLCLSTAPLTDTRATLRSRPEFSHSPAVAFEFSDLSRSHPRASCPRGGSGGGGAELTAAPQTGLSERPRRAPCHCCLSAAASAVSGRDVALRNKLNGIQSDFADH